MKKAIAGVVKILQHIQNLSDIPSSVLYVGIKQDGGECITVFDAFDDEVPVMLARIIITVQKAQGDRFIPTIARMSEIMLQMQLDEIREQEKERQQEAEQQAAQQAAELIKTVSQPQKE